MKATQNPYFTAAAVALLAHSAHAAAITWNGSSDATWATAGNWVGAIAGNTSAGVTSTADIANIDPASNALYTSSNPITVDAGRTVNGLYFYSATGGTSDVYFGTTGGPAIYFNGGGGQLQFVGSQTINGTPGQQPGYSLVINAPIVTTGTLASSSVWVRNNSLKAMTVNGAISGLNTSATGFRVGAATTGPITLNGVISNGAATSYGIYGILNASNGIITLNGANTYTGPTSFTGTNSYSGATSVNAGILTIANTAAKSTVSAGTLFVNNPTGSGTGAGNVVVAAGAGLGGDGSIAGNLTYAAGSRIPWVLMNWWSAPSLSAGLVTINGTVAAPVKRVITSGSLSGFTDITRSFPVLTNSSLAVANVQVDASGFTAGSGTWTLRQAGNTLNLIHTSNIPAAAYDSWAAGQGLTPAKCRLRIPQLWPGRHPRRARPRLPARQGDQSLATKGRSHRPVW